MTQNAWCSLCSNKESHCSSDEDMLPGRVSTDNSSEDNSIEDNSGEESHCSGEEMLPVRVSADNCRGGAVSSAR